MASSESWLKKRKSRSNTTSRQPVLNGSSICCSKVVSSFEGALAPEVVLAIIVELEYVVDLRADSRKALLEGLHLVDEDADHGKIGCFGRPCHLIGLRLAFPPFRVRTEQEPSTGSSDEVSDEAARDLAAYDSAETSGNSADWLATVTVVSLDEDPTKISVEIDGRWMGPQPWDNVYDVLVDRLKIAEGFLREQVGRFLEHFRSQEDEP